MGKWTRRGVLSAGVLGGTGLVIGIAVRPGLSLIHISEPTRP